MESLKHAAARATGLQHTVQFTSLAFLRNSIFHSSRSAVDCAMHSPEKPLAATASGSTEAVGDGSLDTSAAGSNTPEQSKVEESSASGQTSTTTATKMSSDGSTPLFERSDVERYILPSEVAAEMHPLMTRNPFVRMYFDPAPTSSTDGKYGKAIKPDRALWFAQEFARERLLDISVKSADVGKMSTDKTNGQDKAKPTTAELPPIKELLKEVKTGRMQAEELMYIAVASRIAEDTNFQQMKSAESERSFVESLKGFAIGEELKAGVEAEQKRRDRFGDYGRYATNASWKIKTYPYKVGGVVFCGFMAFGLSLYFFPSQVLLVMDAVGLVLQCLVVFPKLLSGIH